MRNRKWFQACMAGVLSAAMLTTSVSVWGAEFSDGEQNIEVAAEQSEEEVFTAAEEEAPVLEDSEADAAEAADVSLSKANFPDDAFRKYLSETVDTDKNNTLSAAEISAVSALDMKELGIANLKGVERFPKLTDLYVPGNKLKSVDLTKNTYLANINVSGNDLAGTLDLSKCTRMETINYSDNALTKVVMPSAKYLKKVEMINASKNKFRYQTDAGLYYKNISGEVMSELTEINVSDNLLTSFTTNGCTAMILDLRNNRLKKFSGGEGGFQNLGIYLDGKYNALKSTSKVDFAALGNTVPQRFSCNASVAKKVVMVAPRLAVSANWDEIKVSVGSSSDDASYKLERKMGNGSYKTVKTWEAGELEDTEFGEDQLVETDITPGASYTYRLTATVMVQNADKVLMPWSVPVEKTVKATAPAPTIKVRAKGKGQVSIAWNEVPGADGYRVYYGTNSKAKTAITKGTTDLSIRKKGLKRGKYYYFRVCAYKMVDGKPVLAPFCKSVKVKAR